MGTTNQFDFEGGIGRVQETGRPIYTVAVDNGTVVHGATADALVHPDVDTTGADRIYGCGDDVATHIEGLGWIASQKF